MIDHNENWGSWIAAILCIVLIVMVGGLYGQEAKVDMSQFECPACSCSDLSAQEIADLVVIPGVEVPEFKSDEKVSEVWDKLYESDVLFLEAKGLEVTLSELDDQMDDELLDFLEDVFEGFDVLVSFVEDEDDREVEVLNLGLDDEEDKEVEVLLEFKLKYDLKEGEDEDFKDRVYVKSLVSYDEDEGYEAELVYSL